MDGILLVNKEEDCTSFEIVRRLKVLLKGSKVGHGGTLDPFARGLLIMLIGKATRLFDMLSGLPKEYLGVVELGIETDTYDRDGVVVAENMGKRPSLEDVAGALKAFEGQISQMPPRFSAVKIHGRRACDLARQGREFQVRPREVEVFEIDLESYEYPDLRIRVKAGKGFYMRTLAHELGQVLGVGGHLKELKRLAVGPFRAEGAVSSLELEERGDQLSSLMVPLDDLGKVLSLANTISN